MVTFQTSYINLYFNFSRSFENWNKTLPVQKKTRGLPTISKSK